MGNANSIRRTEENLMYGSPKKGGGEVVYEQLYHHLFLLSRWKNPHPFYTPLTILKKQNPNGFSVWHL